MFQAAPVLESEPIQHAAQMQEVVNNMQAAAAEVKVEADAVGTTLFAIFHLLYLFNERAELSQDFGQGEAILFFIFFTIVKKDY